MKKIDKEQLKEILEKHRNWLLGNGGKKANLRDADLRHADLLNANLRNADFRYADLCHANLGYANLLNANLRHANLRYANLLNANLRNADFRYADFCHANLGYANLLNADFRNAVGIYKYKRLLVNKKYSLRYLGFKVYDNYFIAYKSFGEIHKSPKKWKIEKNSILKDNVNLDIGNDCGCGINAGTLDWCQSNCIKPIWELKVPFSADIVIPIFTNGKIRVSECKLIKEIKK